MYCRTVFGVRFSGIRFRYWEFVARCFGFRITQGEPVLRLVGTIVQESSYQRCILNAIDPNG